MPDKLIGKQMRRWEIDQRLKARFQRDEVECATETPIVTVSRQWGSGGTNIAKLVAKELDLHLYDREIIDRVAELSGADPRHIEDHDERQQGIMNELVLHLLEGRRTSSSSYFRALVRVVRRIAKGGNALIVGRASTCILPDSYRVRIVAPEPIRVARLAELHDFDLRQARRMVLESDRQRYHFIRANFSCDPNDPLGYDLVINTERCSIEHAAALIVKGVLDRREGLSLHCEAANS
jgi:cytidylate kinase